MSVVPASASGSPASSAVHASDSGTQLTRRLDPGDNLLPVYLQRYDREQTRRAYRNDLSQFFGTEEVDLSLAREATFLHVNQHLEELEERGLKSSTMRRRLAAVRGFFEWLEALELVDRNPANRQLVRRVRKSGGKDRSMTVLTRAQAHALLKATGEAGEAAQRDRALIEVLLHCVLRRSEAAGMNAEHVRPLGHYWVLDLPRAKGGSDQYVKIPASVVETIEDMKDAYGISSGPLWRSFSNRNRGGRISPNAIYEMVRRTAQRAGLPEIGAHALRHTGCTLAIESGASLQQVKTHARHKNVETTMIYLHQRDKLRDSAADHINID
jgi:site-specific recombinase XerD